MAAMMITGFVVVAVSFMIVFLVKICGQSSRMKICKILKVATEQKSVSEAANFEHSEPTSQPLVLVEIKHGERLTMIPKRSRSLLFLNLLGRSCK